MTRKRALLAHKDALSAAVLRSLSYSETLRSLGLSFTGNNNSSLRKAIAEAGISTAHFRGAEVSSEALRRGRNTRARPLFSILRFGTRYSSARLRERLWREELLPRVCLHCGQGEVWNGQPLQLQLDHANGNSLDNRLSNLRILCPNCHSQTPTYAGKAATAEKDHTPAAVKQRTMSGTEKIAWPPKAKLAELVWTKPLIRLADDLGVSDNAIRKRCKKLQIALPAKPYWQQKAKQMASNRAASDT